MSSSIECKLKLESTKPWRVEIKSLIPLEEDACLAIFDYRGMESGTSAAILIDFGPIFLLSKQPTADSYPTTKEEIMDYKWYDYDNGEIADVQKALPTLIKK